MILAASLGAAMACAPVEPPRFPAKPPGCALEAVERLPRRPYVELETFSVPGSGSMREVLDLVNERACRDGADAIYAPKGGRTYSYAIAIKWKDAPAPTAPPASAPPSPPTSPAPPTQVPEVPPPPPASPTPSVPPTSPAPPMSPAPPTQVPEVPPTPPASLTPPALPTPSAPSTP